MDNAIRPNHYKIIVKGQPVEVRDIITANIGKLGYRDGCQFNVLKYAMRADEKNGTEDRKKCDFYNNEIIKIDSGEYGKITEDEFTGFILRHLRQIIKNSNIEKYDDFDQEEIKALIETKKMGIKNILNDVIAGKHDGEKAYVLELILLLAIEITRG